MDRTTDMPMKWHKFLIYFSLWAGAVICFLNGFQRLTGSIYGSKEVAAQIYNMYGSMKTVDTVFGVLFCILGVFMIYVRFQLAGFKKGAPSKLIMLYILQLILSVGYILVTAGVCKLSVSEISGPDLTTTIAISIAMTIANYVYYKKRSHLFGEGDAAYGYHTSADTARDGGVSYGSAGFSGTAGFAGSSGSAGSAGSSGGGSTSYTPGADMDSSAGRFCPGCGAKIEPGDTFCAYCGRRLS